MHTNNTVHFTHNFVVLTVYVAATDRVGSQIPLYPLKGAFCSIIKVFGVLDAKKCTVIFVQLSYI